MIGKLAVLRLARETKIEPATFAVRFLPLGLSGWFKSVKIYGEEKLITWLEELGVNRESIDGTLQCVRENGRSSIENVELTEEQLKRYGLESPGIVESIREYLGVLYASSS